MIDRTLTAARSRAAMVLAGAITLSFVLTGCNVDLLKVDDPENLTPGALDIPSRINGAFSEFDEAYFGTGNNNVQRLLETTASLSDELVHTGTFTTRKVTDRRDQFAPVQGNSSDAAYLGLHQARRQAREVADDLAEESPNDPRIARLRSIQAYVYIAFGENFCAPLPFSQTDGTEITEFGQPLSQSEIFSEAVNIFDQALSVDPNSHLAAVGKGRALLDRGEYQAAAEAVSGVPTSFVEFIRHSANSTREQHPLFDLQDVDRFSAANREGTDGSYLPSSTEGNGLDYLAARDPRVPWGMQADPASGTGLPVFWQLRYPTRGSDAVLADGIEARLIEAEAALQAGDVEGWLSILNALRADVQSLMAARFEDPAMNNRAPVDNPTAGNDLEPLEDPGTHEERVDIMFRERAFWLWLSNHRLGDMRRLIRQYGRSADEVFPTGEYHNGAPYQNDVALPVDFDESNNPNYEVSSCDLTVP